MAKESRTHEYETDIPNKTYHSEKKCSCIRETRDLNCKTHGD
jgi:hypothetical protein